MATQTINTVPSADANFITDLQTFLQDEMANRAALGVRGVQAGGIGATDASLAHTISTVVAFVDGYYVTDASISHTYTASKRTYVYLSKDAATSYTVGGATMSFDGNFVFAEMAASTAQLATPSGLIPLFYADTSGVAITSVTDLRTGTIDLSYYSTLSSALTALGTGYNGTIIVPEQYVVGANTNASSYTKIKFDLKSTGGSFNVLSGFTLTLLAPSVISALWNQKIFPGAGTVLFSKPGVRYPEWWLENTTPGTTDMTDAIQAANDAVSGGRVLLLSSSYAYSDITIDRCILDGQNMEYISMVPTGTITVENSTGWECGKLWNMHFDTASGYASTVIKLTGQINRQSQILKNIYLESYNSGADVTASSIGLQFNVSGGAGVTSSVASSSFYNVTIEGYETGFDIDATSTGGTVYVIANEFYSFKLFDSITLCHIEDDGTASINKNAFYNLLLQGNAGVTVNGLEMVGVQKSFIQFGTDGTVSGSYITCDANTWLNHIVGGSIDAVSDSGDRNYVVSDVGTKITSRLDNSYGREFESLDISQGATEQYLLLAQKDADYAIAGEIVGRRSNTSSAGENSIRIYVDILADSGDNSYPYWEIDYEGVTAPTLVELTYGGDVWYALNAVSTGTSAPLDYALFNGQYTEQTNQLTWQDAGDCSSITNVGTSSRAKTRPGNIYNNIKYTAKGEPTDGNVVLTAAMLLGGLVDEDPEGAANWTTDTAANIVAAVPGAHIGATFETVLMNDATGGSNEVVTIVAGAGVTLHGNTVTLTEGTNETAKLVFRLTNVTAASEAVDCYILTGI